MDHFWQIGGPGSELAARCSRAGRRSASWLPTRQRARLGLMVGGVHYRNPGLWVKAATTLDVLSGGRAWLGIGAAWNQAESEGLGFPWPPLGERFEMLEETLQIAHGMWQGERGIGGGLRRPPVPCQTPAQRAAVDLPAARSDPHRRWRREEDPAPRRPVRRRLERVRRAGAARYRSTPSSPSTARRSGATLPRSSAATCRA